MATTKNGSKYNADFLKRASAYITERGLFPEPHGSTIQNYCRAMGISDETHSRWLDKFVEYVEVIKKANSAFNASLVLRLEGSLIDRALGNTKKKKTRTTMVADENGDPVVSEKIITEEDVPADTTALIFALKNIAGDKWKDKQEHDINMPQIIIQASPRGIKAMDKLNELGDK